MNFIEVISAASGSVLLNTDHIYFIKPHGSTLGTATRLYYTRDIGGPGDETVAVSYAAMVAAIKQTASG